MSFVQRLAAVRATIDRACARAGRDPAEIELLAVSKTFPVEAVVEAIATGQRSFGENRVQELERKAADPRLQDVAWHLIGSLQTNKVDMLLDCPGLQLLHSLDRERLVEKLASSCAARGRVLDVLLQVNATGEDQKHGVSPIDAPGLARSIVAARSLRLRGVMAMGPLEGEPDVAFREVARLHAGLRDLLGLELPVLSLGMSHDLEPAIAAGSTLVRIGTALFGSRG